MASIFSVTGLCAAPFTPFEESSHDLNLPVVKQQVDYLMASGVQSAFVGGTTGESLSMTIPERKSLLEEWLKVAPEGGFTVIAHVGCEALRDTIELTKHAAAAGASAVGLMPPTFFKPNGVGGVVDLLAEVCKVVPTMPVYYYHIDCMTGVHLNTVSLLTEIEAREIPNFRGIKFTDYKIHEFQMCQQQFSLKFDMLYGRDEMLLSSLAIGAKGAVGSTYNYMGNVYREVIDAYEAGDMPKAQAAQMKALQVIGLYSNPGRYGHPGVDVGRAITELCGVPLGPPRLPKVAMSAEGKATLKSDLDAIGFFGWK